MRLSSKSGSRKTDQLIRGASPDQSVICTVSVLSVTVSNVYLELNVLASTVAIRCAPLGESLHGGTQKVWRSWTSWCVDVSVLVAASNLGEWEWCCNSLQQTPANAKLRNHRNIKIYSSFFQFLHSFHPHIFAVWFATWKCTPCIWFNLTSACRNLSWNVFVCVCDLASAVWGQPLGSQSRSTCCSAWIRRLDKSWVLNKSFFIFRLQSTEMVFVGIDSWRFPDLTLHNEIWCSLTLTNFLTSRRHPPRFTWTYAYMTYMTYTWS